MSNKINYRRERGHIRGRDNHPCGRKQCGVCGPKAQVQKRQLVEKISKKELRQSSR